MDAYGVVLGTGGVVRATGVCKDVNLKIANLSITHNFLPLPLGSVDVILGVTWLETLGKVIFDYKLSEMEFSLGEWVVILQGDRSLVRSQVSLKSMMKTFEKEDQGVLIELSTVEQWGAGEAREHIANYLSKLQPEIQKVLQSFSVFEPSNQLPPPHDHDHAIELEPGARAMNVRSYRYPQFQNDEIEKLVKEMLLAGIIQPSKSVFSSPMLLVKKKDGSWRFCADYRALYLATIPDKYLIPIVDELLDELFGATIFSKIDLKSGYHQIRVQAADVHKTVFRTHEGHYEFLVMSFGLKNGFGNIPISHE